MKMRILLLLALFLSSGTFAQSDNFRFKKFLAESPDQSTAFAIKNSNGVLQRLLSDKRCLVKQVTPQWVYVQTTPSWIANAQKNRIIESFYFEFAPPVALNDTTLVKHHVKPVHQGLGGLQTPFTGKDVIIGYVDQGLDHNHPDFQDALGKTRVLYYWDHTLPFDAVRTPAAYGYGQVWTAADIDNDICTSNEESSGHGTSVSGVGSSDGSATGRETGMAPDSKIIFVETDFNLQNWTLTIADAVDFVFSKADELGLPAVVNLSLGSYLGSHDGNDPAAELMETLLDEQPGRIVVCAAGNSGAWGKYHVHGEVDADTSFVWMLNNPGSQLGANTIYMDLWTDLADATWNYALAANLPGGTYEERAETVYRLATTGAGTVVYDTLWNGSNRIATIELYPEFVGNNFHMEIYFSAVDSTNYLYALKTVGSGNYDGWTGSTSIALNNMQTTVPTFATYPPIQYYHMPDTLQTIVSSWNCSEKIVSVGNIRGRVGHIDGNGNQYLPAPSYTSVVNQLSPNSSKGPNRHGVVKPDISASGDVSLSAGPFWILNDPGWNGTKSDDLMHVRNGGTSMASPVVAGIAALYLEKCGKGTYQHFMNAMQSTAFTDAFTGTVPNYAYGYGKIHALNLLLSSNYTATIIGVTPFCSSDTFSIVAPVTIENAWWSNNDTATFTFLNASTDLSAIVFDQYGCKSYTDTLSVVAGDIPPTPVVTLAGNQLICGDYAGLQWYENGVAIPGETNDSLTVLVGTTSSFYVVATSPGGCSVSSNVINFGASITEQDFQVSVYPNPTNGTFMIQSDIQILDVTLTNALGQAVTIQQKDAFVFVFDHVASGSYFARINTVQGPITIKILKK